MHSGGVYYILFLFECAFYQFLVRPSLRFHFAALLVSFSFVFVCLMFLFGYNYGGIMLILHMLYSGFGKEPYIVFMKRCYKCYRQIS